MLPGPKPVPGKLKVLHGVRPSRINRREPAQRSEPPNPPSWLSREARAEWRRLVRELPRGLLGPADRQCLAVACESWARWADATRRVMSDGVLVPGDRGMVKHPACQIARDAEATMSRAWAELGLSPAARSRLEMPEQDENALEGRYLT
jgi:P27 family predicted phage terminase small subunit